VAHNDFVEKPEGKRELWKPRHRWEDNITQDLKALNRTNVSWINWIWTQTSFRLLWRR
jgi:hypothetical protein